MSTSPPSSGLAGAPTREAPAGPSDGKAQAKRYRRDVQGLRALGLVVMFLCHAEFSWAGGGFVGLDIFFVISGFLITGLIQAELRRTGKLSISAFYARRVRRLLPLAILVLAVVVVASWAIYTPVQNDRVAGDVVTASLYVVNWHFAAQEVDYFAVDPDDSPIQHYWSLSVEEQFYLVWPALLLLAFVLATRRGGGRVPRRAAAWAVVLVAGVPSLLYSAFFIDLASNAAYFSTLARVWEFALGGALALALPRTLALPRFVAAGLGAVGIAVILATTYAFSSETPYPGHLAILPTLATAAIVVAGTATVTTAPIRLLSSRPFQYLGAISYAWYLWHWPALVFARALWGPIEGVEALLVIGAAWVPTAITHRWVEQPFRYASPLAAGSRRALAFGAGCMGGAIAMAAALVALQPTIPVAKSGQVSGAAAARDGDALQARASALRPPPRTAKDDRGRLYEDGCLVQGDVADSPPCVYGNRESSTTVVLFGDSHAMHYFPALQRVALRRGWRLVALTRAGCPPATVDHADVCNEWRERALRRIETRERPRLVVVGGTTTARVGVRSDGERLSRAESEELLELGFVTTLRRLRDTGARVAVMKDLPRADEDVPSCVSASPDHLEECAFADERAEPEFDERAVAAVRGVRLIDGRPLLCPKRKCPAVMGNALVYRDDNHFTATFARTLAPWLRRELPRRL